MKQMRLTTTALLFLTSTVWAGMRQPGYPVPQIVGPTNPQSVAPGGTGFTLTIYGANFIPGSTVNWNRQPRATTYISARELQAEILASDIAVSTAGMITVTTTTPKGPITSSPHFQVEVHAPRATMGSTQLNIYPNFNGAPNLVGDLNSDGYLDLAGISQKSSGFSSIVGGFMGNGDGTFHTGSSLTAKQYPLGGGSELADFDGDGNLDYVYVIGQSRQVTPLHLAISFGNGDGTFRTGPTFGLLGKTGPVVPGFVVVGDYNQDGVLDIATSNVANHIEMFLGNGDGTFSQGGEIYGPMTGVQSGDFNGDGKLDLIGVAPNSSGTEFQFRILLGNGDGTFQPVQTVATISGQTLPFTTTFFVNDFNQDGKLDLAFGDSLGRIGIVLGNGDGTFQAPFYYTVATQYFFSFALGDFNSDGKTDIIVQQYQTSTDFSILLGNGDGTFQSPQVLPVAGILSYGIAVADFNNDGLLDFAYTGSGYFYMQK